MNRINYLFSNKILENKPAYIIAEIGVNHNGDINLAKKLIKKAKLIGANAVKFQSFNAESLADSKTPKVKYQKSSGSKDETHFQMLKKLELSFEDQEKLFKFAIKNNIDFLSTPYDIESAKFLNSLNVKAFKVASADIVDLPLHEYLATLNKPVILSVGMASLSEIDFILKVYKKNRKKNVAILHAVSNYPASDKSLNMKVIDTLKNTFQTTIGYSDHSIGTESAIIAISKGVKIIERHFTLDKSLNGPDHSASSSPSEFKFYVEQIRKTEIMLGSPIKKCQKEEMEMKKVSRKSLFTSRNLMAGHKIVKDDLTSQRPGNGIYPINLNKVVGKTLKVNLKANKKISWKHLNESTK
jgi:sialic acid synthase SpsE